MYYLLRKDCYIRKIGDYGYIKSSGIFNDLVFDKSGQIFLSALDRKPKSLEDLSDEIAKSFNCIKSEGIFDDVKDFFEALVDDGYVVKGKTIEEAYKNNVGFNYSEIKQINLDEDYTPKNIRSDKDSQLMLNEYFKTNPYLSNFQIELTSKCNERCIHCYIPHEYKLHDIKPELYYKVLKELKEMGTLGVTLSGGEPLLHPNFKEFLKAAKDNDFYVHILTNLYLLDDEMIEIMRDGNTCGIQVSLYSMVPEHHDGVTTIKGSFEKTRDNILRLIDNNIPVQINCPVMKINKDDVADVIKWGHEHKIRVNIDYAIMAEYDHQTTNLANRLSPEECKKVILDILKYDEDYESQIEGIENINDVCIDVDENEPMCGVGINTACMVANGNVYPCPGWQGYICGNVKDTSLKDIWLNSPQIKHLRNIKQKDFKKCLKCENRAFCAPCMSRFANESKIGNPFEIATHFCDVAKVNKETVIEYFKNK